MKHLLRILSLLILVSAGLFLANCGGSDPKPKSEEEVQLGKFTAGQWSISSVTFDGLANPDMTTQYAGMKVTFTGTFSAGGTYNYTSIPPTTSWPTPNAWKPTDEWTFKSGVIGGTIIRDEDGQEMAYEFTDGDKTLKIVMEDYQGASFSGRVKSVDGDWTFIFTRL